MPVPPPSPVDSSDPKQWGLVAGAFALVTWALRLATRAFRVPRYESMGGANGSRQSLEEIVRQLNAQRIDITALLAKLDKVESEVDLVKELHTDNVMTLRLMERRLNALERPPEPWKP